ncbi:alpha/beta fold hydrolase [Williamsia sp. SKLECPSW1]
MTSEVAGLAPVSRDREIASFDGTKLFVQEYGPEDAPLLVFSHGWACQGRFWRPQIEHFAPNHRVVVYDQRGHGWSDRGRVPFSASLLADDLESVVRAVATPSQKAIVVGHSMGGMSVMSWAGEHPDSVSELARGAMLASTGPADLVSRSTLVKAPRRLRVRAERAFAAGLSVVGPEMPDTRLSRVLIRYGTLGPRASAAVVDECADIVLRCPPQVRGMWGGVLATIDVSRGVDALSVPVTVIVGGSDRLTPTGHSVDLALRLATRGLLHEIVRVEGAGHMVNLECTQEFNNALDRLGTAV